MQAYESGSEARPGSGGDYQSDVQNDPINVSGNFNLNLKKPYFTFPDFFQI